MALFVNIGGQLGTYIFTSKNTLILLFIFCEKNVIYPYGAFLLYLNIARWHIIYLILYSTHG